MRSRKLAAVTAILLLTAAAAIAQKMEQTSTAIVNIKRLANDFSISDLHNPAWQQAEPVTVTRYWSGETAPPGRNFIARLMWSKNALYVRFEANQAEPLHVFEKPDLTKKKLGLWDRDVCEIFIAPDRRKPGEYFEFEVAPTGEWVDLRIHATSDGRDTEWDYNSGMQTASKVENDRVLMAVKVKWKAIGKTPKTGDTWLGNLYRCVGAGESRGYLAWRPTMTEKPNFHVPERFGEFVFVD